VNAEFFHRIHPIDEVELKMRFEGALGVVAKMLALPLESECDKLNVLVQLEDDLRLPAGRNYSKVFTSIKVSYFLYK